MGSLTGAPIVCISHDVFFRSGSADVDGYAAYDCARRTIDVQKKIRGFGQRTSRKYWDVRVSKHKTLSDSL